MISVVLPAFVSPLSALPPYLPSVSPCRDPSAIASRPRGGKTQNLVWTLFPALQQLERMQYQPTKSLHDEKTSKRLPREANKMYLTVDLTHWNGQPYFMNAYYINQNKNYEFQITFTCFR